MAKTTNFKFGVQMTTESTVEKCILEI